MLKPLPIACAATLFACSTLVDAKPFNAGDLIDIPLEELMQMDAVVSSASKRDEKLRDSAAAVFVITAEDIRRAGVSSIPDALRMAPGIQVGRIGSNEWGVSSRGLGGRFSRFLLVLIDGRSIYDSLYSGVNWDEQNIILENIERIEVVRGPGGSLWGANAVNGVVNIITKSASTTPRFELSSALGDGVDQYTVSVRHGGDLAGGKYRLALADRQHGEMQAANLAIDNTDWRDQRLSATYDRGEDGGQLFELDLDYGTVSAQTAWPLVVPYEPWRQVVTPDEDKSMYAVQARWQNPVGDQARMSLRLSVDDTQRESSLYEWNTRDVDADLEYNAKLLSRHDLVAGINLRNTDSLYINKGNGFDVVIEPGRRKTMRYSVFLQDQYRISSSWQAVVGARLDDHSITGRAFQPTLRFIYAPSESQRLWGAVSRAESTPSRATLENNKLEVFSSPGSEQTNGLPVVVSLANEGRILANAQLLAYELGYRYARGSRLEVDITGFSQRYKNLLSVESGFTQQLQQVEGQYYIDVTVPFFADPNVVEIWGGEASVNYQPAKKVHMQYSGSYIRSNVTLLEDSAFQYLTSSDVIPKWQHSLRLLWDVSRKVSWDFWLSYVDDYEGAGIDSFTGFNTRLEWKARSNLRLSIQGNNLIDSDQPQFAREAFFVDHFEVPRYWTAQLVWTL